MKLNRWMGIGALGVALTAFGAVGCSASDGEQGGSVASPQSSGAAPAAKKYGGRAAAFSARVDLKAEKPASLGDYDGENLNISDTKALPDKGGNLTASVATINAGQLLKATAGSAWTHGEGNKVESSSSTANAALFGADTTGFIDAVMGKGTLNVDVEDLLKSLLPKDLMDQLFGPGGILEGGIRADVVQQDASASCDDSGTANAESAAHVVRLFIKGKEYKIVDSGPNQLVFGAPELAAVYVNAQEKSGEGASAGVDSASIRVVALNGKVDAKVSRASASIECGGTDGSK